MKNKKSILTISLLIIVVVGIFAFNNRIYNFDRYTADNLFGDIYKNEYGYVCLSKYDKIKNNSKVEFTGLVTDSCGIYKDTNTGEYIHFYKIVPLCKDLKIKDFSFFNSPESILVLSPNKEVNEDIFKFDNYLEKGDIVKIKGNKFINDNEFSDIQSDNYYNFNYVQAKKVELIDNVKYDLEN